MFAVTSFPLLTAAGWILLVLGGAALARNESGTARRGPPAWVGWLLLGGALLLLRWPLIQLPHELYPDESQMIAGALTLRHDPVFWRSVDGGTAGPVDYYALLPATFFPGPAAYAAARVIGTLAFWGALVAAGESLALLARRPAVRLAALPALVFGAFTTSPEFVHYSSELMPVLLVALAVFAGVRQWRQPAASNLWAAGLLLGAVPWAKLQAAPVAAALGVGLVGMEFTAGRRSGVFTLVAAALVSTLLVLAMLVATDQMEHMVVPYLWQNLLYTETGRLPVGTVALQQWDQALTNGYLAWLLAGSVIFCSLAAARWRKVPGGTRRAGGAALVFFAASLACVLAPGRPYQHYLNLLFVPLTFLLGAAVVALQDSSVRRPLLLLAACGLAPLLGLRLSPRPDPFAYYNTEATAITPAHAQLIAAIQAHSTAGETLGVWGWRPALYVDAGRPQAACQAHTESLLITGPSQPYYLRRYYEKIVANAPPVFVDTAGPGDFRFTSRALGHEMFPRLRDWIQANYTLLAELDGARVYVRHDRLAGAGSAHP